MLDYIRDYKILQKLGEGGMGSVYLAEDGMLDRKVAIKVLNPALTIDNQFVERFRQEAKVQLDLRPNDASVHTQMGAPFRARGDYEKAILLHEKAIRLDPACSPAYFNLGNVYADKGDESRHIECYREAARLGHRISQGWLKQHGYAW